MSLDTMDGIDRSTAHSVHAVARGSVEETPATFLNAIATTKRQSHHCHLRLCTIVSILAQLLLLLHSQQAEFQMSTLARVCRSVQLFCLLADEHTHTPRAAERAETRRICMCRGGKISIAAPLILLCMCAAATDLPSICLFCPAVCLFEAAHTAVHRNTATQHSHLPYKRLPYSYITPPSHLHYYHYHIPSRLHAYYLPIAEP